MSRTETVLRWILDVIGKIIAMPLVIPGFVMLYVGNLILDITRKEV